MSDDRLRGLEKRISKIYSQAEKELTEKVNSFFANFERLDKKKQAELASGKITEDEYKTWRKNKLLRGNDYIALRDNMTDRMLDANKIAASYMNGEMIPAYTKGFNRMGKEAENAINGYSFTLINEDAVKRLITNKKTILPYKVVDGKKDVRWNTKKVNSAILQGIIQGESSKQMAKRLLYSIPEMNKASAIRNARTAFTSASNHGRLDGMKRLQDDGMIVEKEWFASIGDGRTREAHVELHHATAPIDEPFRNSIGEIMFPGDPDADPANVYNCRCSIATKILGFVKRGDEESGETEKPEKPDYSVKDLAEPKRPRRSDFEDEDAYYTARDEYRAKRDAFNQQMDQIVEKALDNPRFKTKEEFIDWAEKNDIKILDDNFTDKIDLRAMTETSRTLDEMFERFPEAKAFDFYNFDGSIYHGKFALMADDDGFMSCRGGIAFNPKRFENFENALRDSLYSAMSGETVMGDGTFSTMIRHEYGHQVESYIRLHLLGQDGISVLDDWRTHFSSLQEYRDACAEVVKKTDEYDADLRLLFKAGLEGQSEYSGQDLREFFAEGFAEWSSGGTSEFARKFGEFFKRWYR